MKKTETWFEALTRATQARVVASNDQFLLFQKAGSDTARSSQLQVSVLSSSRPSSSSVGKNKTVSSKKDQTPAIASSKIKTAFARMKSQPPRVFKSISASRPTQNENSHPKKSSFSDFEREIRSPSEDNTRKISSALSTTDTRTELPITNEVQPLFEIKGKNLESDFFQAGRESRKSSVVTTPSKNKPKKNEIKTVDKQISQIKDQYYLKACKAFSSSQKNLTFSNAQSAEVGVFERLSKGANEMPEFSRATRPFFSKSRSRASVEPSTFWLSRGAQSKKSDKPLGGKNIQDILKEPLVFKKEEIAKAYIFVKEGNAFHYLPKLAEQDASPAIKKPELKRDASKNSRRSALARI